MTTDPAMLPRAATAVVAPAASGNERRIGESVADRVGDADAPGPRTAGRSTSIES